MSETATAPAPAAPTQTPAAQTPAPSFLDSGAPPAQSSAPTQGPTNFFADSFIENGQFKEGWSQALADKYPALAGKLSTAKDQDGALSMMNHYVKLGSGRELKGAPNETWQPHEITEYRRAHGVPDAPEQYKFKPDQIEAGVHWPEGGEIEKFLHENHVPASVAEKLGQQFHEYLKGQTQHALGQFQEQLAAKEEAAFKWAEKTFGSEMEGRHRALQDFIKSKFGERLNDPSVKAAVLDPTILEILEEQRQQLREAPLPGVNNSYGSGSASPRQQAEEMMRAHPDWQTNPSKGNEAKRIYELMSLQAQQDKRK